MAGLVASFEASFTCIPEISASQEDHKAKHTIQFATAKLVAKGSKGLSAPVL